MTTTFYAPPSAFSGNYVYLPEQEARHAVSVLRQGEGEEIIVVDGEGGWHRVQLDEAEAGRAGGRILDTRRDVGESRGELTVGLSLLKNKNRFETFLEKAVEIGVDRIVPLRTRRTEKKRLRRDRSRRLLVAALKQCRRSRLPELTDVMGLEEALDAYGGATPIVCHAGEEAPPIVEVLRGQTRQALSLWLGPEGGFAGSEVAGAKEQGAVVARLGPRRLRAETAALVAAGGAMLVREQQSGAAHDASENR